MQGRMKPETILNPLKYSQWLNSEMKRINERKKAGLPLFDLPDFDALAGGDPEKKLLLHAAWLRFEPPFDKESASQKARVRRTRRRISVMFTILPEVLEWMDIQAELQGTSKSRIVELTMRSMMESEQADVKAGRVIDDTKEVGELGDPPRPKLRLPPPVQRRKRVELDEDDWAQIKRGDRVEAERDERDRKKQAQKLKQEREEVFERAEEDGLDPYDELDEVRDKRIAREKREKASGKRPRG